MREVRGVEGVQLSPEPRFGRADRLRSLYFVAAAVLAALVPLILFAGLWVRAELDKGRRDLEAQLATRADALMQRLDAEVEQQISVLQAIAASPSLDEPNLVYFHAGAVRMLSAMPQWATLALFDPDSGRQIVNTVSPVGADLPAVAAGATLRRVAEKRAPAVVTPSAGAPLVAPDTTALLLVPVVRDNTVRHVIGAAVKGEGIQQVVGRRGKDDGFLATVIDEHGRILARSRGADAAIGREIREEARRGMSGREQGLIVAPTVEGQWMTTAFRRSALSGWVSAASIDQGEFSTLSYRATWAMIATGALSLTLAGVLAVFLFYTVMERRITNERLAASRVLGQLDARLLATTQEALAEQRKAAAEREVLLREIYHRVKNNLQIVQSLLRLGSRDLTPDQREPFEAAVRRIGAMARVHTLLYNSPDLASIDFGDYLAGIAAETAEAFGAEERGIRTTVEVQPMRVPLDVAVPLAFIAVELLTNAFKHAFPGDRGGTVGITARQEGEHGTLVVADDGVGVPERPEGRPLGLTIVSRLAQQIGGQFQEPPPGRSEFRVTFPAAAAADRTPGADLERPSRGTISTEAGPRGPA